MASGNSVEQSVSLWLKPEAFTIGSLQIPPHSRLTVNNIKKIVSYAKTKGKSGFPNLSYSVWKHVACTKLGLPEDLAWTYFVTFDLVNDTTPEQHIEFDRNAAGDDTRNLLSAPTLRFVLFLYIQHIHKISLRASLVSGSDEWPSRARSPDIDSRSSSAAGKTPDETAQLTFVMSNLDFILDLLAESDGRGTTSLPRDTKELSLSLEAIEALEYLITGSCDMNKTIRPLRDIALWPPILQQTGYSKNTRSFSFRSFQTWLRSCLDKSPFGIIGTLAGGRHLLWPMYGESREQCAERKAGRIVTNAVMLPRDQIRGNKLVIISQFSKQTVARSSPTLRNSTVLIHRCNSSYIYLLSPLRAVTIEKCKHSTIVLGAVELSLDVSRCENVTVIAATRRITTIGSKSCYLHVLTPNTPLVYNANDQIIFGPYHTFYPQLEAHMQSVGLQAEPNYWDQPQYIGVEHQDEDVWQLLKPIDFHQFVIPFEMEGDTESIPGGLPAAYEKAVRQRSRSVEVWKNYVRSTNFTKDQKRTFERAVEARFQEWLHITGNLQQLDGLSESPSE